MADYNQESGSGITTQPRSTVSQGGFLGDERNSAGTGYGNNQSEVPSYNAHQDEFGQREGDNYPSSGGGYGGVSESEPPHHKLHNADEPLPKPTAGYNDETESFQDAPQDTGFGGPKSQNGAPTDGSGAFERPTSDLQSQFGLEGKTGGHGTGAGVPESYGTGAAGTTGYGATDTGSAYDDTPASAVDSAPAGSGFGPEDTSAEHGAKKEGFMTKLKEKLPGHHKSTDDTAAETDAPPKKSMMTKIKEKLPGNHGSNTDM